MLKNPIKLLNMAQSDAPNYANNFLNVILTFIISFTICLYFGTGVFSDPDMGWHIKAGEIIWQSGAIPFKDNLTFTSDQRWYNLSWSWDILMYWVFTAFGESGLVYLQALLFAALIGSLYASTLYFKEFSTDTRAIITTISGLLVWDVLYLRPQLISYFLALIALLLLSNRKSYSLYLIPLLTIIWVNIHGSFIVMYTVLAAFILGALYERNYSWFKTLIFISALSTIALLINPLGYKVIIGVARTLDSTITAYISEWMPFTFGAEYAATLCITILLIIGGFTNDKIPMSYRVLALLWLLAALCSKRSFGFFGILALPYFGYALNPIVQKSSSKFVFTRQYKTLLTLAFAIMAVLSPFKDKIPYFQEKEVRNTQKVPLDAINFLNKNCNNAKIFNDYNLGGYLALYVNPNIKYFIDGRAGTAFSEEFIKKYLNGVIGPSDIESVLTKYPVDAAFVSNDLFYKTTYHKYFANWNKIYKDNKVTIYRNRNSKACKGLKY
jgi:hypothetical protein